MAAKVIVPDLTTLTKTTATNTLAACNLTLVDGTGSNIRIITSQSVPAGTIVDINTSVTVNYQNVVGVAQAKGVWPTPLATTPTVSGGVTYDKWRCVSIGVDASTPMSDRFTLQTPYNMLVVFAKGCYGADGFWMDSPVDARVTVILSDMAQILTADTTFANYLELIAGYIANRAKNAGLI